MNASEEEFIPEEEAEEGPALIRRLREKLKKAVDEKQEYLEGWQRSRADFTNYKRQEASMHSDKEDRIMAEFVEQLLPALDSLELAVQHSESKELRLVEKQFMDSLGKLSIEKFGKAGETFDPHLHEALAQQGDGEKIQEVKRSGYKVNEKIIRPAQVIV